MLLLLLVLVVKLMATRASGGSSSKHDRKYRQTRNTIRKRQSPSCQQTRTAAFTIVFWSPEPRYMCRRICSFIPAQFCFPVRLQILHSCRFILRRPKFLGSRSKRPNNQGRSTTVSYKFVTAAKRKPREDCMGILLYRDSGLIMCCFVKQNHFP